MPRLCTPFAIRLSKLVLLLCAGVFGLLIVAGGITDYASNHQQVHQLLAQANVGSGGRPDWRLIEHPSLYHLFYVAVLALQLLFALGCLAGTAELYKALRQPAQAFHQAKRWAIIGLLSGLFAWYVAFITSGGEWFLMAQSAYGNPQAIVYRFVPFMLMALIFISLKNDD